ncbi:MAG: inorganic phosphate transporter [Epsilonproteobacteria bacterium]|nr:inorganic phosphate transporter [Campylobacterota bacterium]OIO15551.1 MAG: inorganic phosphate transporter [Helicobacteraceae bacterium CG1_02_36_14]PIP09790.1 MAG: inorganic phosphate transporter [Sulfurimonas sp. CG23_combo_of_CG06-09_8_20_14_all_36_33]PIS24004.1 MAG: inorganic phosphate transporter [Sulfurimonas sp. CG08_land_8_20_14_0_20_36_33]PIU35488.1 MAG: inorganic phosphate transporter [Sulfurimonas sp. CG07_land_8_20_14_0_80_36_56]PIV05409.1 MAG: inorganic phosphate transporter [
MEIQTIKKLETQALKESGTDFTRLGFALFFMIAVLTFSFLSNGGIPNNMFLAVAALVGAYMAMNIGANDVANNVGPAVGSKALTLTTAIIIAAIFEASGALIAGGEVVETIKKGIIDISAFNGNADHFIWAMMAALLAAALWLNFATMMRAPVSTTHSIVGGVMGAGIAAAGFSIVSWGTMAKIAASWVISPLLGAIVAAVFLYAIKKSILFQEDKIASAKKWVPLFVAIMAWAFVTYITLKGLKKIWPQIIDLFNLLPFVSMQMTKAPSFQTALTLGLIVAVFVYLTIKTKLRIKSSHLQNTKESVNTLFTIPLIFSAALLSFAHGANDVANAIGPLAAINDAILNGGISSKAPIPLWVMGVGALGIALGLALYGPKLIKTVGSEITELDQIRAFSIAMAASITVIIASQLGLPVSSTHIAIGGVFGVGFLREWLDLNDKRTTIEDDRLFIMDERKNRFAYNNELKTLESKENKSKEDYERIVGLYKLIEEEKQLIKSTKRHIKDTKKVQYVKRDAIKKIVAAWLITVPAAAILSAILFFMIKGIMI